MQTTNTSPNAATFTVGQKVIANGFPGTVTKICGGQLTGMIEIRMPTGYICVSASDKLTVRPA
jgi:molybdopterin-binding protein